jgi:hypothetical protein
MEIMMMVVMMAMAGTVWFAGTNKKKTNILPQNHLSSAWLFLNMALFSFSMELFTLSAEKLFSSHKKLIIFSLSKSLN